MSKRNIAYIKPQDPSFLAKLKQEIGYKEGPTVDTKRQRIEDEADNSDSEAGAAADECYREDEKPQVVVLRPGIDLTAEEAALEEKRIAAEQQNAPADLSKPIIFKKKPSASQTSGQASATTTTETTTTSKLTTKKSSKKQQLPAQQAKLSFDPDADEDEDAY